MPRRSSLTRTLFKAALLSNNMSAISRGPSAHAKRVVRRNGLRPEHGCPRQAARAIWDQVVDVGFRRHRQSLVRLFQ